MVELLLTGLHVWEVFWLSGFVLGGEYPEGPIVPFIFSSLNFVLFFLLLTLYKRRRIFAQTLITITLIASMGVLGYDIFRGPTYFFEMWKGMSSYQFRVMVALAALITMYQVLKLIVMSNLSPESEEQKHL